MAFPGRIYAPPGPYTQTNFENPIQPLLSGLRLPIMIGTGSEILTQDGLEVVRGSSSDVDQRIVQEDASGRSVETITLTGQVVLGAFNGLRDRIQVRNYPIVDGQGRGATATDSSAVNVTVNGLPLVVLSIDGERGILKLSKAPELGDNVRVTYFFNRTDTLTTDDLSDQVTASSAVLRGAVGETYEITTGVNDELILTIDNSIALTVTLPQNSVGIPWTASQLSSFINSGVAGTTLVASTYENNFGETALLLTADRDILIGNGSSNSTLGFTNGSTTARNRVFYTFEGPLVDGTNGGVTTTDPGDVTVWVDGVVTVPASVDGATRAVTLPFAPKVGAAVTVRYWFNSWQDTFDYLQNIDVTRITRSGATPDRSDYVNGADFVLKNDLILWGTAVTVETGEHTSGAVFFNESQISPLLVDAKQFLAPCVAVTNSSVSPPVTSTKQFQLPLTPTTGNGRNSPLGTDLFQSVSNGRIDLPTNRPDLVRAYWGFGVQDAIQRGPVTVLAVESSTNTITLAAPVPVGASVFASFYYNTLTDQEFTVTTEVSGGAGVGVYSVTDENGNARLTPKFGAKSVGLAGIVLQFPSGTERLPDTRFEIPFTTTDFEGPVEEDVTVTFSSMDSTLGKYTVPSADPYYPINAASDNISFLVDGAALTGTFIDLSAVNGISGLGFHASYLGGEVEYDAASGQTTYDITAGIDDTINLSVDGVLVAASTGTVVGGTLADYVTAINAAAALAPAKYAGAAKFTSALTITAGVYDQLLFHYTGDVSGLSGDLTATITPGTYASATTLAAAVEAAVAAAHGIVGLVIAVDANADGQMEFSLTNATADASGYLEFLSKPTVAAAATVTAATVLVGNSVTIGGITLTAAGAQTPGGLDFDEGAGSDILVASSLVAAISDVGNGLTALVTADNVGGTSAVVTVTSVAGGTAGNAITIISSGATLAILPGTGFLAGGTGLGNDFALLAGLDASDATAEGQTKLVDGPIARRFTIVGDNTGALLYDRLVLRNRLVPGASTLQAYHALAQADLKIEGSLGATNTGLGVNDVALGGWRGSVLPASILGTAGFSDGQVAAGTYGDEKDGQAVVTFYAAGGTNPQNNVFKFTMDNMPVTVSFTDVAGTPIASGASADVPMGPAAISGTVINQIATAMAAAGLGASAAAVIAAGLIAQEGAGFRLTSGVSSTTSNVIIGISSGNGALGFVDGATVSRTPLEVEVLVSALMAHAGASVAAVLNTTWVTGPTVGYFAAEALAGIETDASNAKYLFLQSQGTAGLGTSSSIAFDEAASDSILLPGVGLGAEDGDGGVGEVGISGFYVTSSDTVDGSGTVNDSLLNSGVGQDGTVGQTYRDLVTGLVFTVLPREGGTNYPDGESFTLTVRRLVTTDSNLPVQTIPGVELLVTNTLGVAVGDTALVTTYERGGNQPAVGDLYYVSYEYLKQNFETALYTKLSTIEATYGSLSSGTEFPVTMAAYLAILNGAVIVGIKQVEKDTDEDGDGIPDSASVAAYRNAFVELEGPLRGGILPDILVPLRGDSVDLFVFAALHADVQSLIRHRAERTILAGVRSGTSERTVGDIAEAVQRSRFRLVYPDIGSVSVDQADGTSRDFLVDGTYLAAALSGRITSPAVDVATPWTRRRLIGFNTLGRTLNAAQQNQIAVRGVTIIEDRPPILVVRQGFTTDMTNVLTKTPTVIQIADEVQQQARTTLERFIGIKFLPGILSQIEGQLANTLKLLVSAQIITTFTGVRAVTAEDDPTVAEVEATYQPVFPLLYIVVTFNLRASM